MEVTVYFSCVEREKGGGIKHYQKIEGRRRENGEEESGNLS